MTSKTDYSDQEWFLLMSTPGMIAAAMAGAGKSGFMGTMKEALTSAHTIMSAEKEYPGNELIRALVARAQSREEAKQRAEKYREMATARLEDRNVRSPEQLKTIAIEDCRAVAQLLQHKAAAPEAAEYRSWVMGIATKVASAAKEGGFLGIGGERISAAEKTMLTELTTALGTSADSPPVA